MAGYSIDVNQGLRDAGIPLTVAVDKVAASGGYMMACVARQIIAAPFAVAQSPDGGGTGGGPACISDGFRLQGCVAYSSNHALAAAAEN